MTVSTEDEPKQRKRYGWHALWAEIRSGVVGNLAWFALVGIVAIAVGWVTLVDNVKNHAVPYVLALIGCCFLTISAAVVWTKRVNGNAETRLNTLEGESNQTLQNQQQEAAAALGAANAEVRRLTDRNERLFHLINALTIGELPIFQAMHVRPRSEHSETVVQSSRLIYQG